MLLHFLLISVFLSNAVAERGGIIMGGQRGNNSRFLICHYEIIHFKGKLTADQVKYHIYLTGIYSAPWGCAIYRLVCT